MEDIILLRPQHFVIQGEQILDTDDALYYSARVLFHGGTMSEEKTPVVLIAKRILFTERVWEAWRTNCLRWLEEDVANGKGLVTWWETSGVSGSELAPFFEENSGRLRTLTVLGAIRELRNKTPIGEELIIMAFGAGFSKDTSDHADGEHPGDASEPPEHD